MKTCLIVTGGKLDLAFARSFIEGKVFHRIIAVDGGLAAAEELGLVPDSQEDVYRKLCRAVKRRV